MSRYFEFEDAKSSKFWEIELQGSAYTVRYGKIGTNGQSTTKDFGSTDKAKIEYDKIVAEKIGKGYIEKGGTTTSVPVRTATAVKANVDQEDFEDEDDDELNGEEHTPPIRARVSSAATTGGSTTTKSGATNQDWQPDEAGEGIRYFEFQDDKSNKFWEIELSGQKFRVRYGKIGTDGQSQIKDFSSPAEAKKEYEKLIAEKTKKGYEEML